MILGRNTSMQISNINTSNEEVFSTYLDEIRQGEGKGLLSLYYLLINTSTSQCLPLEEKNQPSNLTHEILYDNFNKKKTKWLISSY